MAKKEDNNNLTKSEIVDALKEKLESDGQKVSKALCGVIVKAIFDGEEGLIADWLSARKKTNGIRKVKKDGKKVKAGRAHRVTIPGFGTFGTTYRKARKGRHPKTQKEIKIAATYAVSFRPGKNLKEAIGDK